MNKEQEVMHALGHHVWCNSIKHEGNRYRVCVGCKRIEWTDDNHTEESWSSSQWNDQIARERERSSWSGFKTVIETYLGQGFL